MGVKLILCGPFINESERIATEYIRLRLESSTANTQWILLTNLANSSNAQRLSDELDLVVIGPPGAIVIEIKHWNAADLKRNLQNISEHEADKLNEKVRRLAGKLRKACAFDIGFVEGRFLFTKGEGEKFKEATGRKRIRGIAVFGLIEWKDLLDIDRLPALTNEQIASICRVIEPMAKASLGDKLRTFGDFFDLESVPGLQDAFHRIYRGRRKSARDKVILHIYDLSASKEKNALEIARREFDVLQRLQKSQWLPSIMDSFREAAEYPGELYFFSYIDTEAASLADRARDEDWPITSRIHATKRCVEALKDLHERGQQEQDGPILHRNLSPQSIRLRSNGEPLLTQLHIAKIPGEATVAGVSSDFKGIEQFIAPEVLRAGIGVCSTASDIYSLCASLRILFDQKADDPLAKKALKILASGMADEPSERSSLESLLSDLQTLPADQTASGRIPVQFWDEDTTLEFQKRYYRIITKLGQGSVGTTFKVMEVDITGRNDLSGPYVAKAITNEQIGKDAAAAYAKVRAQTGTLHLAGVLEVIPEWHFNEITALLRWVKGDPLSEWKGALPLYFDDLGEGTREEIALSWLRNLCDGLAQLHQVGLVHGDVSPRNIIVDGSNVTLTDFDLACAASSKPIGGTPLYCSLDVDARTAVAPSDDVYALAATMFSVLFDRSPFQYSHGLDKKRGLNWEGIDQTEWKRATEFFDRATNPNPSRRFASAVEAISFLNLLTAGASSDAKDEIEQPEPPQILHKNVVPWLSLLLQGYPGSPKGNAETRGLDSEFAKKTYVETGLDARLAQDILDRKVSLVVLCGNAGDGKTAFLQHLATKLGLEVGSSAQRIWDYTLEDGLKIHANLDGSAAYQGRSASELLNEFFAPFQTEGFPENLVHLIAINDGPLLAWLNDGEQSYIADQLYDALDMENPDGLDSRIRFIDLNARSLVGGINHGEHGISTGFMDQLLGKMLGGDEDAWMPCQTCAAQSHCTAWRSVSLLRDEKIGPIICERLTTALLAVHQRGEVHITARSLRAALTYIFFGTYECTDLHADPSLMPALYYDRTFNSTSEHRQGDLLAELELLDPAIESHPLIDRYLLEENLDTSVSPGEEKKLLYSLRRRAYFEWPDNKIVEVGGSRSALGLARGRHLDAFLRVGTGTDAEREMICADLCEGIARMEDLPEKAFRDPRWVPMKITPRTPTETAFWVNKPRSRFSLKPRLFRAIEGIETLHTHVVLTYEFESGHVEELIVGAELFDLLMELKEGYQISDAQSDDVFANLSIFKQRLAQEDDRRLLAWNPLDERIFEVRIEMVDGIQKLVIAENGQEVAE